MCPKEVSLILRNGGSTMFDGAIRISYIISMIDIRSWGIHKHSMYLYCLYLTKFFSKVNTLNNTYKNGSKLFVW